MTQNQINYQNLVETKRANRRKEELSEAQNTETNRANLAKEAENYRSNVAREQENIRSNLAREIETNRSNLASEDNSRYSTDKNYRSRVDSAYINKYGFNPTDAVELGGKAVDAAKDFLNSEEAKATANVPRLAMSIGKLAAVKAAQPLIRTVSGLADKINKLGGQ